MSECRFSLLEAGVDGHGAVRHRSAVVYDKPCESQMCGGEYVQRLRRYYTARTGPVVLMDKYGVPRVTSPAPAPAEGERAENMKEDTE